MTVPASLPERLLKALGTVGIGPRVLKTALAAGLAWWVGNLVGEPTPVFASVAAILALDSTVAGSLARTGELLAGMTAGLILAGVVFGVGGSEPLTVALLILAAMATGSRLRFRQAVVVEFSITALLVMAYTDPANPYFGLTRIWEGVLGGGIAILVNSVVLPPEYLALVRSVFRHLLRVSIDGMSRAIDDVLDGASPEAVGRRIVELDESVNSLTDDRATVSLARDALRFSPLGSRGRAAVERYARGAETLEHVMGHALGAARVSWQHTRRHPPPPPIRGDAVATALSALRDAVVCALEAYGDYVEADGRDSLARALQALDAARGARAGFLEAARISLRQEGEIDARVDIAAIESELEHMLDDLTSALAPESSETAA